MKDTWWYARMRILEKEASKTLPFIPNRDGSVCVDLGTTPFSLRGFVIAHTPDILHDPSSKQIGDIHEMVKYVADFHAIQDHWFWFWRDAHFIPDSVTIDIYQEAPEYTFFGTYEVWLSDEERDEMNEKKPSWDAITSTDE